ncbi:MAG: hypothetical protein QF786_00100 [Vicinamibacterales bacterium]|jgi:hypothetical protein|nr:hypothetical protein [Vicinamibacterales bacterium]
MDSFDRNATAANRRLAIRVRALEILRNSTGVVMTMLEAVERATAEVDARERLALADGPVTEDYEWKAGRAHGR